MTSRFPGAPPRGPGAAGRNPRSPGSRRDTHQVARGQRRRQTRRSESEDANGRASRDGCAPCRRSAGRDDLHPGRWWRTPWVGRGHGSTRHRRRGVPARFARSAPTPSGGQRSSTGDSRRRTPGRTPPRTQGNRTAGSNPPGSDSGRTVRIPRSSTRKRAYQSSIGGWGRYLQVARSGFDLIIFFGPAEQGVMSKSKISVGTNTVAQALGMSTMPLMWPSTGAVPRMA